MSTLGMFPATAQITPDGEFAFVVNFNLHGDRVPSSVSVVATDGMLEVARIPTCLMPHGSRINAAGHEALLGVHDGRHAGRDRHAHAEGRAPLHGDAGQGGAARPARRRRGRRRPHAAHGGHGAEPPPPGSTACSPTWAQPSADGRRVFVACNGSSEIVEIDVETWTLVRRMPAGPGVYNLAVTHDGRRLLATNRRDQSVSVIDIASGHGTGAAADQTPRGPRRRRERRRPLCVCLGRRRRRRAGHRRSDRPGHADDRRDRRPASAGRRHRRGALTLD